MQMKMLITGASEGIGRSLAVQAARQGYAITAVARNAERLQSLVKDLEGSGHDWIAADLLTADGIGKIASTLGQGKYDVLINNAGFAIYGDFARSELKIAEQMLRVNCDALMQLSHAFLRHAKTGDALINISSSASFLAMPGIGSVYSATKAFVTMLSECLWQEQRGRGVYVLGLCPGATLTRFNQRAGGDDNKLPKMFTQTSDQVAAITLKHLRRRRRAIVVCGLQAPVIALSKLVPRQWIIRIAGAVTGKTHS